MAVLDRAVVTSLTAASAVLFSWADILIGGRFFFGLTSSGLEGVSQDEAGRTGEWTAAMVGFGDVDLTRTKLQSG